VRREEKIPNVAQAEYTSDSSYSAEDFDASTYQPETVDAEPALEEADFSYNYESEAPHIAGRRKRQSGAVLKSKPRRSKTLTPMKPKPRKKVVSATTIESGLGSTHSIHQPPSKNAANPGDGRVSVQAQRTNLRDEWSVIFDVVSDDPNVSVDGDMISRQGQEALLAFGHPIYGPHAPRHLFYDEGFEFEDCDSFRYIVTGRVARLRQRLNDLRLQESRFMDSLSRSSRSATDEEGYATTPEWISLVSLEDAYHTAIASFAAQVVEALGGVPPTALPSHLEIVLQEIASLLSQLPDCDSLFSGCKAYFFFFEVASRDAATTPLFTALSRAYWYCLDLLVTLRLTCSRWMETHGANKQAIEDAFLELLPAARVGLAVARFLFDLYLYLPSSHRLENEGNNAPWSDPPPALSLWMLVRSCCARNFGLDRTDQEQHEETDFWPLLQNGYRDRYFDELAQCFVRGESCGGYLREIEAHSDGSEQRDEVRESQLLALEATWDIVAVLSRICGCGDHLTDAE
jgi:hypothetical protein